MQRNTTVKTRLRYFLGVLIIPCLPAAQPNLLATGYRVPDQDAFAAARGEAFAATADNPSAIYYNPAGITQLEGHNLRGGFYGIFLEPSYESASGRTSRNQDTLHAIPELFYTYSLSKLPLSFGVGFYTPYGLSMSWPQDCGFRTVATEGSLNYYTINPVVAWRILPSLSIAAGLRVNYAQSDLKQGLVWPSQSYDQFRFKGDGWDTGYNLGVLWKVHEKVSLGASFKSPTTFDLQGNTEYYNNVPYGPIPSFPRQSVAASAEWPFPMNAVFGVSYRPTPKWNLEFNADYTDWSCMGTVTIQQASGNAQIGLPQNIRLPMNWEPSWYYEFGATRYLAKGWSVSAGYIYNENSVPDAHYNPLVADLDRHFLSAGLGYKGQRYNFDVAYQFGFGPTRTVSGSGSSLAGQTADGDYQYISHAVMLSVGVHF